VTTTALEQQRRRKGVSKRELARLSGIDIRTIRRIENDAGYQPTLATLGRLAATLNVGIETMLPSPYRED